jgi:hypothetical protein
MYLFDACLFLIVVLLISDALQLMLREIWDEAENVQCSFGFLKAKTRGLRMIHFLLLF